MRIFVLIAVLCAFSGCKNTDCSKIKPFSDAAALAFSTTLQCSGVDAMKADFMTLAKEKGLCKAESLTGLISAIICPILVPYLISFGTNQLPTSWDCKATATEAVLTAACNAIPF